MSLLGNLANEEITNFLRTATIKNAFFAIRSKLQEVRPEVQGTIPENELPYYKHVAGEYILRDPVVTEVTNPKTGVVTTQTYNNTSIIYNRLGQQIVEVKNTAIYNRDVFDEMMYVTSLDNGTVIPFTLENLHKEYATEESGVHSKTLEAYKIPSRYYDLLCEKYPKQVDLIKAIIYPVKGTRSITATEYNSFNVSGTPLPSTSQLRRDFIVAAKDYTLLECDENILEENERFDIITYAKQTLDMIDRKWNVKEFYDEQNYPVVLWAMMWCILRLALIQRRYSNIRTPFVHSSHVWDYLVSKGLESYKGYLTPRQTSFLYKNINYILNNRGKQKATNILVDEFLTEAGLNIKAKTIVLDTSKTLDTSHQFTPSVIKTQCSKCSRAGFCHKNISTYQCPDFVNLSTLCVAEPIVLTEEFVGARRSKIIETLVSKYGYTKDQAETKYERALIWNDIEVESIREEYNRDQLTDTNCSTETLDSLISREHASKLEPVYNEKVVEQQAKELAHIAGTVAPTKILEIVKKRPQAKYVNLFNKFITETMMHFAPRVFRKENGEITSVKQKVMNNFVVSFDDVSDTCSVSYNELIALIYMGVTKEHLINLVYDHIVKDTEFSDDDNAFYFRTGDSGIEDDLTFLINANLLQKLQKVTEEDYASRVENDLPVIDMYYPGQPVPKNVYRWSPHSLKDTSAGFPDKLQMISGHEFITNFADKWHYDFPIPNKANLNSTWKFGKPVPQQQLIDSWYNDKGENLDALVYIPSELEQLYFSYGWEYKALLINGCMYIVSRRGIEKDSIWDGMGIQLSVDGEVKQGAFFYNNDEIAVIPKYFRWYGEHLEPDVGGTVSRAVDQYVIPDENWFPLDDTETPTSTFVPGAIKYDFNKNKKYVEIETEHYFDIDNFVKTYVDIMENVTDMKEFGQYLTTMFQLLEDTYAYADSTTSVKKQLATKLILDTCLVHNNRYEVDLTGSVRNVDWPISRLTEYPIDSSTTERVAFYSDWLRKNSTLKRMIDEADTNSKSEQIWKDFNVSCLDLLINQCTLPYVTSIHEAKTIEKLKQLVLHLSSYRITLIDADSDDRGFEQCVSVVSDIVSETITEYSHEFFSPIMDSVCSPHIGCFEVVDKDIYFRTEDAVAIDGKVYYYPEVTSAKDIHSLDPETNEFIDEFNLDRIEYVEAHLRKGDIIEDHKLFERVDIYNVLGVSDRQLRLQFIYNNGKWMYRTGYAEDSHKSVPATDGDPTCTKSLDAFLFERTLTKEQRAKLSTYKRRKLVRTQNVIWNEWRPNPDLDKYLAKAMCSRIIDACDKITFDTIKEL